MNIITDRLPPETHNQWIGIDIEMFNMNDKQLHRPTSGDFALMSIAIGEDVYMIDDKSNISLALNNIEDNWWIFQNAKFDLVQLRRWAGIPPRNRLWDTMLMERVLFGGYYDTFYLSRSYSQTFEYPSGKRRSPTSFTGSGVSSEQLFYSAMDAYVLPKIVEAQKKHATKDDFNVWMNIDLPAMWAFMDFRGFAIDKEKWEELALRNKQRQEFIDRQLPINPRSSKQVVDYLRTHGFKNVSNSAAGTIETLLERYPDADGAEVAKKVLESRTYGKRASTYGMKFIENYLEEDEGIDTIYACYWVTGAETGRTSCVSGATLLHTNRGSFRFDKYMPQIGDCVRTHTGSWMPIVRKVFTGHKPIFSVHLSNGNVVQCTSNHRLLTPNGWKET